MQSIHKPEYTLHPVEVTKGMIARCNKCRQAIGPGVTVYYCHREHRIYCANCREYRASDEGITDAIMRKLTKQGKKGGIFE